MIDEALRRSIKENYNPEVSQEDLDDSWARQLPDFAKECNYNPGAKRRE